VRRGGGRKRAGAGARSESAPLLLLPSSPLGAQQLCKEATREDAHPTRVRNQHRERERDETKNEEKTKNEGKK
jgi:hypothetical protein